LYGLGRRRGRTSRVALAQQAIDVLVVLLLGEQVAALPALAPIVLAGVAVDLFASAWKAFCGILHK
jgi:hypothetical protein